jgi:glyoxylase-like metal-dependent hydrolase (beta-lactamase superfamily II)
MVETMLLAHVGNRGRLLTLTPDVACLPLSIVNVYFVGEADGGDRSWVLVDAGLGTSEHAIVRAAGQRYGPGTRPGAIVLTHGHFDHVGSVRQLAERWDVPVFAHELELPYLTGRLSYPPPDPTVGGGLMSLLAPLYPRGPIDLGDRVHPLPGDGSVPGMPGWRWIHTPGHSPGHVSLFRDEDRALIAGDAFVTVRQESAWAVLTQRQEVWRPPAYYTLDWQAARRSVEELTQLHPNAAGTGHGQPMFGQRLRSGLEALALYFDRVAVPTHGRYVCHPMVTDERGLVGEPPLAADRQWLALASLGMGVVIGTLLVRRSKRVPHSS